MKENSSSKKRLIAQMVAAITVVGIYTGLIAEIGALALSSAAELKLNGEKEALYTQFMSSPEFEQIHKDKAEDVAIAYVRGDINYDQFMSQFTQLNSRDFIVESFDQHADEESKQAVNNISAKIDRLNTSSRAVAVGVGGISSILLAIHTIARLIDKRYKRIEDRLIPITEEIPNTDENLLYNERLGIITIPSVIPVGAFYQHSTGKYIIPAVDQKKRKTNSHKEPDVGL